MDEGEAENRTHGTLLSSAGENAFKSTSTLKLPTRGSSVTASVTASSTQTCNAAAHIAPRKRKQNERARRRRRAMQGRAIPPYSRSTAVRHFISAAPCPGGGRNRLTALLR